MRSWPLLFALLLLGCPGAIEDPSRFGVQPTSDAAAPPDGGPSDAGVELDGSLAVDSGADAGEEPAPSEPLEPVDLEAEEMELSGYVVDPNDETRVRLPDGVTTGSAVATFEGSAGTYELRLRVLHENDGQPTLAVRVQGIVVLEETFPLADDGIVAALGVPVEVALEPGDVIRVDGTADELAWARFDRLELRP